MHAIVRLGDSPRWSDVVIYRGEARWVEVAEDPALDILGQVRQVLEQIDATLARLGSRQTDVLQVIVYLQNLEDAPAMNVVWDSWVQPGHAPIRACVQVGLSGSYLVEMVVSAAVPEDVNRD